MEIPFNILILPFLGGYIFVRFWNHTRIHTMRSDKDRTIIRASIAGLFSIILAYILYLFGLLIPCRESVCVPDMWNAIAPFENSGIPVAAFVIASLGWIPLNYKYYTKETELNRAINEDADPLEMLLKKAKDEGLAVSITMTNEKVYIGRIVQPFNPALPTKYVSLLPLQSGYRDASTKKMNLTINYAQAYQTMTNDLDVLASNISRLKNQRLSLNASESEALTALDVQTIEKQNEYDNLQNVINSFIVVISANQIASANIFDANVHQRYFHT
jgi:hypothetical protein